MNPVKEYALATVLSVNVLGGEHDESAEMNVKVSGQLMQLVFRGP